MSRVPKILPHNHPAYTEAIDAMRRYHEAQKNRAPALEVERLRLIAESQFQAVTDYQMKAFGIARETTH